MVTSVLWGKAGVLRQGEVGVTIFSFSGEGGVAFVLRGEGGVTFFLV